MTTHTFHQKSSLHSTSLPIFHIPPLLDVLPSRFKPLETLPPPVLQHMMSTDNYIKQNYGNITYYSLHAHIDL